MAALPSEQCDLVRFVAKPGADTEAFRQCLISHSISPVDWQVCPDLCSGLLENLINQYQSGTSQTLTIGIVVVDSASLNELEGLISPEIISVMCGRTNQDALKAFNAGIDSFFCLSADVTAKKRQIQQLIKQYRALTETIKWRLASENLARQRACSLAQLINKLHQQKSGVVPPTPQIALRCGAQWQNVSLESIRYVEAAGDYMCVYTQEENLIVRSTLTELSQRLPADLFTRVNRSVIVNTRFVKRLIALNARVSYVELTDGSKIKISRRLMPRCSQQLDLSLSQP
ncbi:LytR/AlgR family response regulator transcription factor [Alteromonas lipolytica]|uniref:HTH LytTR-type domain-containing protein n=1 Tax=Alteromonas lipolytica TaxID=1856405 RepID=A0A1E8FDE0_9ALTE|nr:LytTR family DNA-binding domain-containing protein [Alteromonas lipolytica]OFI33929.1 hypothetical protein BFC17_20415 [Alteromonas lipolytica]GGF67170.1 hypothetical protein GCM10011338_19190 [Alteromonas lipolytica]